MRWIVLFAVVLSACGSDDGGIPDEGTLRNGVVKLQFLRGVQDENPFLPGMQVSVAMVYGECLVDYYVQHSDMRQDGVEGEPDFAGLELGGEGWMDRLCDETSQHADCEVLSIEQQLDEIAPKLTVTYSVSGDLEGRQLRVGPFPKPETAACTNGEAATVRVGNVSGLDAAGDVVWTMESFDPDDAIVGQGAAISIYGAS
jgi:hypothetical protein